jgi:hypothetical protein
MFQRLALGWGRGCVQALAVRLAVGAVVLLLAVICLVPAVYLINANEPGKLAYSLGLALLAGFILLSGAVAIGAVAWMLFGNVLNLDGAFKPLGLQGSIYLLNGRQYQGQVSGRRVTVYFFRGPTLELYVQAAARTRVSIGARDRLGTALAGLAHQTPLPTSNPALERFSIYPAEEAWASALLADPNARDLIGRLMTEADGAEIRHLMIQPNALLLRLSQTQVGLLPAATAQAWVNDLSALARIVEALPPPQQVLEPAAFEGGNPATRARAVWIGVAVGLAIVVIVALGVLIPALLLGNH